MSIRKPITCHHNPHIIIWWKENKYTQTNIRWRRHGSDTKNKKKNCHYICFLMSCSCSFHSLSLAYHLSVNHILSIRSHVFNVNWAQTLRAGLEFVSRTITNTKEIICWVCECWRWNDERNKNIRSHTRIACNIHTSDENEPTPLKLTEYREVFCKRERATYGWIVRFSF